MATNRNHKPILLHNLPVGPNPWKVGILLTELNLPFENVMHNMPDLKQPPYEAINPNGRAPAIQDPNTGLTLWESGAIIQYLISQYDTAHVLSHATFPEKHHTDQWLHFQTSGQGPYFGQAAWFSLFHPESVPSAKKRYVAEMRRVIGVLDRALEGREWLVGDKCTYADLSFFMWNKVVPHVLGVQKEGEVEMWKTSEFGNYTKWHERMEARPAVKKALAMKEKLEAEVKEKKEREEKEKEGK